MEMVEKVISIPQPPHKTRPPGATARRLTRRYCDCSTQYCWIYRKTKTPVHHKYVRHCAA